MQAPQLPAAPVADPLLAPPSLTRPGPQTFDPVSALARQPSRDDLDLFPLATPTPGLDHVDPVQSLIPDSLPGTIRPLVLPSPANEAPPLMRAMDSAVGLLIGPLSPPAPLQPPVITTKSGTALRLPSFEELGIANPHPDRARTHISTPVDAMLKQDALDRDPSRRLSWRLRNTLVDDDLEPRARALSLGTEIPAPSLSRASQTIEVLTPPEDSTAIMWQAASVPAGKASPASHPIPAVDGTSLHLDIVRTPADPQTATLATAAPRIQIQRTHSDNIRASSLNDASEMILANLRTADSLSSPIKVLSHALPTPSPTGFAFPYVVSALQAHTPGSPLCWINVFHALPGRFSLSDIPTSPPSTPDPPVGGQDYFTHCTFDSAVPVLDYQDNLTVMPRSPHPIVPPSTIAVAIVERYIPPTNAVEFAGMFKVGGRSLLVDRLVEISPDNGSLLFIYPTKAGAETFARHYLGPVLDPLLRSMMTLHQIPMELAASVGRMSAISHMYDFDALKAKLQGLCREMSQESSRLQRFSKQESTYTIQIARTHTTKLDRAVWAEKWWTKQEKTRIKDTVLKYMRGGTRPVDALDITPSAMVHSVLDGVIGRPYPLGREPVQEVELGVFLIKRTLVRDM